VSDSFSALLATTYILRVGLRIIHNMLYDTHY